MALTKVKGAIVDDSIVTKDSSGNVGIGTSPTDGTSLRVGGQPGGASSVFYPFVVAPDLPDSTIITQIASVGATFNDITGVDYVGLSIQNPVGITGVADNKTGIWINNLFTNALSVKGIRSSVPNATGNYNLYVDGGADNYFAGNVGIGTTLPAASLDVNGDTVIAGSLGFTNTGEGIFWGAAGGTDLGVYSADQTNLSLRVGGANRVTITSTGKVGIGTSTPTYPLTVTAGTGTVLMNTDGSGNGFVYASTGGLFVGTQGASKNLTLVAGNTTRATILGSNGNVGIGTTTPGQKLVVDGLTATHGVAMLGDPSTFTPSGGSRAIPNYGIGDAGSGVVGLAGYSGLDFYTSQTLGMRLDAAGRLGIGTNTPQYSVHLYGHGVSYALQEDNSTYRMAWQTFSAYPNIYALREPDSNRVGINFDLGNQVLDFYTANELAVSINQNRDIFIPAVYSNVVSGRTVGIASNGEMGYISSSRETKTNIQEFDSSFIYNLKPKAFNYRKKDGKVWTDEAEDEVYYGLIAEEVEGVDENLVIRDNDGKVTSVSYEKLFAPMIQEIQSLRARVAQLETLH